MRETVLNPVVPHSAEMTAFGGSGYGNDCA